MEALKEAGLDQFIPQNYNDSQLRGFVKEIAREVFSRAQDEERVASAEDIRAALPEAAWARAQGLPRSTNSAAGKPKRRNYVARTRKNQRSAPRAHHAG